MRGEERIKAAMQELGGIGPMLPGTLSEQYNVCGKASCRCKHPVNPVKHGPYFQLSFTVGGHSSTMFVKSGDLQIVRQMSNRWKRFKELGQELAEAYIDLCHNNGVTDIAQRLSRTDWPKDPEKDSIVAGTYELQKNADEFSSAEMALKENRDQWKSRALQRTAKVAALKNTIRDLQRSRESWKQKARQAEKQLSAFIRQQPKIKEQKTSDEKKNEAK